MQPWISRHKPVLVPVPLHVSLSNVLVERQNNGEDFGKDESHSKGQCSGPVKAKDKDIALLLRERQFHLPVVCTELRATARPPEDEL